MSRHIVVDPNIIISNFAYRYLGRSSSAKFSQDRHLKGIPNLVPHDNPDDSPLNSGQLKAVQHDLTEALRTETDPNKQTELLHKLGAVRRQIEHLIGQSNPAGPSASSEQARTQKNSILHQSVTSGVVNTSPFMRSNAEHQQPATPKQKTTYDAVNPVKTTPPTTSSTRGQSQYKVTTQPATTQLVTPTDDNITTGRAIASYVAILAAVTIAWTIVAKPGNNTTDTAATGLNPTEQASRTSPAEPNSSTTDHDERVAEFQSELNQIVSIEPIIFRPNEVQLSNPHKQTLDKAAETMSDFADMPVKVVGSTTTVDETENTTELSLQRAENVRLYLVQKGVNERSLSVTAEGKTSSSGENDLENLDQKVEFEVQEVPIASVDTLRVAIVAPSAANDLAFSQSIVDAVNLISTERGDIELVIEESMFVPEEAGKAIKKYASQDFDLVIAHGSEYGSQVRAIAIEYPNVTFAWGTAHDTFGLPNVYAYEAASEQGGYVLGALSATLSQNKSIGVIGPIEAGDAKRYIDGFKKGAEDEVPNVVVNVEYIDSFADTELAAETAARQLSEGADILTGTGEMVVGAIPVVGSSGGLWFGTQSSQASLAPNRVVASQIYHWEVILRQVINEVAAGNPSGRAFIADLENGGLTIELNTTFQLPMEIDDRKKQIIEEVQNGSIEILDK